MKYKKHYLFLVLVSYALLLVSYQSAAQSSPKQDQYTVNGTVTDSYGPMPGVHVLIKGTNRGTFTDKDGAFAMTVAASNTLVFSYLGYRTQEMSILGRTTLEVELLAEATQLQEVEVNAGYYTVKERERTGSISRVTAEEIELQPVVSPLEALQGRMAGVEVIQSSGVPGNAPTIRIRGRNSLREEGNYPLYIIDGMPIISTPVTGGSNIYSGGMDPLSTLNLANIESIEVLKDADATAIYGSRGANGVILITSKKGVGFGEKPEMEIQWYSGLGGVSRKMDLINTQEYLSIRRAALENDNREPTETADYDLLLWNQQRYTDWQEELYGGTSTITNLNVSISGGNETTSFRLGGSYHKEGTVFPGDHGYNKVGTSLHLNHTSKNKKFGMNLSINYGLDISDIFSNGGTDYISTALILPPNAPDLYNDDGSLHWKEWEYSDWDNPLASVIHRTTRDIGSNIVANLGLSYELLPGLFLKSNLGYTNLNREFKGLVSNKVYSPEVRVGIDHLSQENHVKRKSWIIEPQLVYNKKIGWGSLDALIGATFQQSQNNRLNVSGEGFVSESLISDLSSAEAFRVHNNENIQYNYNAVFARLGYNYIQKYFINLTGRRDGSSRFGPNNRFANFGAIGGAWIFSEESFIKNNIPFLNFGKLRGSYGTTGSDQIGDYGYLDAYEATAGAGGLFPTQLTNPDYSWEINKKLEAALDLGFVKDRIKVGVSWYRNHSSSQLVGLPLPSITGFNTVQANLPATVENTGWEFELAAKIFARDFKWQTFINFTIPRNKLLNFPQIEQTSYANTYRIGHPLNIRLLYRYNGVDPDTGLYRVVDVNTDGSYDFEDRVVIKNFGRKYYGGINNNISYKAFNLDFLWEFVSQEGYGNYRGLAGTKTIQTNGFFKEWQYGENKNIQRVSESFDALIAYYNSFESEHFIMNSSFIRLKTLSINYNLPKRPLKSFGLNGCKLFLQVQNLLTITDYNGLNVESPGANSIPTLRTVTLGAKFNF